MRKSQGFTLIELMVTIAVLAIVAMIAAPSMMQLIYKKQLETEARDLAMTLSNVRGTAVSLRKNISLEFKNQENIGDKFHWWTTRPTIHVLAKGVPEGITFTPTGLAQKRITSIRKLEKLNPNFNDEIPEDPLTNPKKIIEWDDTEDLVFEVCHEKLTEIKSIKIFKSGVIDRMQSKPLIGDCK
ncbi:MULTISPECIES: pilus assembly FimT family protein [Acinetobacter]|uniref:pilus assembly FimT family protein n=1 Tax=Acinetobacter TaxID=469 RepID=UPI0015D24002|nr:MULTISPECIES: prepilin-type N-terminal cleavage/methylation domain-containing protein [Acinetobacter]MDM1284693.1 prepilin-type N-terminal cleavage/methylation domain-containing protein [Acinetobacter indicus]